MTGFESFTTTTRNPNALWVALQLHETWEYSQQPQRLLIFDRGERFSVDVISTVKAIGSQAIRTASRSPWQNGVAERWVGRLEVCAGIYSTM